MSNADTRVGILISGRGTNMVALVEAMLAGRVPAVPAVVVSNVPGAAGLARAGELGVATEIVDHRGIRPREAHEQAVAQALADHGVRWVCLAGYMRLLRGPLLAAFPNRILNIHPSLLPAFPGLDAQEQALAYGVRIAGCTVHLVDEQCDHGPIVAQAAVPVLDGDDVAALSARILAEEHRVYPEALRRLIVDPWRIEGRSLRFGS